MLYNPKLNENIKITQGVFVMLDNNVRKLKNNDCFNFKNNSTRLFSYSLLVVTLIAAALITCNKSIDAQADSVSTLTKNSATTKGSVLKNNNNLNSQNSNTIHGTDNECEWSFDEETKILTITGGTLSSTPINQLVRKQQNNQSKGISPNEIQYIAFQIGTADYGGKLKVRLGRNSSSKFANLPNLVGFIDLNNVDASEASDLSSLFENDSSLKELDLTSWDTISNRDMNSMFKNDTKLARINLNNFRTDSVFDFSHMFEGDAALTTLNLANWKTGNVKNMSYMFNGIATTELPDIVSWQTYNVTNMSYMFRDPNLKQLNLSHWDTGNIFEMTNMLDGLGNNSDGFVLSLGKHRLKPAAFANLKMPQAIAIGSASATKPAGKTLSVADLANLYDKEDKDCPAETYVSQPITWPVGSIDLDSSVNNIHIPANKINNSNYDNKTIGFISSVPTESSKIQDPGKDSVTQFKTIKDQAEDSDTVKLARKVLCLIQVYDQNGSPIKGFTLEPGLTIETYGVETINNQKFYKLGQNIFANATDIEGNKKKIVRNSYVYNKKGKRVRKLLVKKGKAVRVYGNPIKIKKKLYYVIDKNQYIKVNNIA